MSNLPKNPSWSPICPNHMVALIDLPFPLPAKGIGICPISRCEFSFEAAPPKKEKLVVTKDGKIEKSLEWSVTGDEKK